jgi:hypothetical protein
LKSLLKFLEPASLDSATNIAHQLLVVIKIMKGIQPGTQDLIDPLQMVKVS